jgi:hypothetical protein
MLNIKTYIKIEKRQIYDLHIKYKWCTFVS